MNNNFNSHNDIEYIENHIGGKNNDSIKDYENQKNIISEKSNEYINLINYYDNLDKNKNDSYYQDLSYQFLTSTYRINNYATYVDDINISNPVIYPKTYDQHFEYLQQKNLNPINTLVVKTKNYINIDSSNRNSNTSFNIDKYINLDNNSLEFFFNSNILKINLLNANKYFNKNDHIILRGFQNYSLNFENLNYIFTNGSNRVIIDLLPNFKDIIPYYDILIKISYVINENNGNNETWKNIPLDLINQEHKIYPFMLNDDYRLAFDLPINYYSDNNMDNTLISNCNIIFFNIGNYPINLINSDIPNTDNNLNNYLIVKHSTNEYLEIDLTYQLSLNNDIQLDGIWDINSFKTGINIQIGKITEIVQGYKNSNNFIIPLNTIYNNVCAIKIISSEIPYVTQNINSFQKIDTFSQSSNINSSSSYLITNNNKFYWQNIIDNGIYEISLDPGYYSLELLKNTIETKTSMVERKCIYKNYSIYKYNIITVDFIKETNMTKFNSYNLFILPNCLNQLSEINNNSEGNYFIIKINHNKHNLNIGDKIFISDSTDYYYIDKYYINLPEGHIITNVINNNFYEISLKNINLIQDMGNTKGGFNIKIKTFAIFRLFFNYSNTFGSIIGFPYVGYSTSITPYCGKFNNFTITNHQKYFIDISKTFIINNNDMITTDINVNINKNNYKYILLQATGFNLNSNVNGPPYFYKFLLNGLPNTTLFNTFVNSPIYLNPPIDLIKEFQFKFITPDGNLVNFDNQNYSLTLEITCINNYPENTNLNPNLSRI